VAPDDLPPLPEPDIQWVDGRDQYGYDTYDHAYSAEALRAYVLADRAARAVVAGNATSEPLTDEQIDEAWISAQDAFDAAMPKYLRGHSEWRGRVEAAIKSLVESGVIAGGAK
jgi:protoporphyrinogen oxidase